MAKYLLVYGEFKMQERIFLEAEHFDLLLDFQVFESDIAYPSNTTLSVCISSNGFSASAMMEVDIKQIASFCKDLEKVYALLKGTAKIEEAYGEQYILFSGDGLGHIMISGVLSSNGANGFWQELKFENSIDQTYFPRFLKALNDFVNPFKM